MDAEEFVHTAICPRRQLDIAHRCARLARAQLQALPVHERCRLVEELGDQLLDVRGVGEDVAPRVGEAVEEAVGVVEAPTLQTRMLRMANVPKVGTWRQAAGREQKRRSALLKRPTDTFRR